MAGLPNTQFQRILAIINGEDEFSVPLLNGGFAKVDAADAELISQYAWIRTGRYARRAGGGQCLMMHRLIMGGPRGPLVIDHIDNDGLNNCRHNLRWASHRENMRNRVASGGASRFKGVWLDRAAWRAELQLNGRKIRLGSFTKEVDAARAYDRAARKYFGEFAKTNKDLGLLD